VRNTRWREILYEDKRFHYGALFISILFMISVSGVCLYSYCMDYANDGSANLFSAYFGHLFSAFAHGTTLAVIQLWVFGRTQHSHHKNTTTSSSMDDAMGDRLQKVAMWCFLVVACLFFAFYQSNEAEWGSVIMITALIIWMGKPCLNIIEQIRESTKSAEVSTKQERKELLADDDDDDDDEEEEDGEKQSATTTTTTTTTSATNSAPIMKPRKSSLWKLRVVPFFGNPWPLIFLIFGLGEIFWISLNVLLPWYLSYLRIQVFVPVALAALSSILVFEYRFARPGPPKDHPQTASH